LQNVTLKVGTSFIAIEAAGIKIGSKGQIVLDALNTVDVSGTGGVTIESDVRATVDSLNTTIKGDATTRISGGGMTEVRGGVVKIN
jgi:hypothetical protein